VGSGALPAGHNGGCTELGDYVGMRRSAAAAAAQAAGPPPEGATSALLVRNLKRPLASADQITLFGSHGALAACWLSKMKTHAYLVYEDVQSAWAVSKELQGKEVNKFRLVVNFVDPQVAQAVMDSGSDPAYEANSKVAAQGAPLPKGHGSSKAAKPSPAAAAAATSSKEQEAAEQKEGSEEPAAAPAAAAAAGGARRSALDRLGPASAAEEPAAAEPEERGGSKGGAGGSRQPAAASPPPDDDEEEAEEEVKSLDDLFRKTKAKPPLYWLPLTEEQVAARKAKQAAIEAERAAKAARGSGGGGGSSRGREAERGGPGYGSSGSGHRGYDRPKPYGAAVMDGLA
jgi:apoptotic chromatin condensation inducer in the nucleus